MQRTYGQAKVEKGRSRQSTTTRAETRLGRPDLAEPLGGSRNGCSSVEKQRNGRVTGRGGKTSRGRRVRDERARSHSPVVPRPLLRAVSQSASGRVPPSDLASGIGAGEQDGSGGGSSRAHLGDVRAREDRERVEDIWRERTDELFKQVGILSRERTGNVAEEVVGLGRSSLLERSLEGERRGLAGRPGGRG